MTEGFVFDRDYAVRFVQKRKEALDRLIPEIREEHGINSALDAGCGVGYFTGYLQELGLETAGIDGRERNIIEARKRYPGIDFHLFDVEDPGVTELGVFDLVLCLGLLYHLENPFMAIRNLEAMTGKLAVVESMATPEPLPIATLMEEGQVEDQSLRYIAFVPSESCIIKMLYHAGFQNVYRLSPLPDHEDFHATLTSKRKRTMLIASKVRIESTQLESVSETYAEEIWLKIPGRFIRRLKILGLRVLGRGGS